MKRKQPLNRRSSGSRRPRYKLAQRETRMKRMRQALWFMMLTLGGGLYAIPVLAQVWGQEEDEGTGAAAEEAPAPLEASAEEIIEADEPEGTAEGRLTALTLAGSARLMAFQDAVATRIEGGATGVVRGFIHHEIELGISHYLSRTIEQAERDNAVLVIFELETPGGRVDAAIMMRDALLASEVPTVAFINHRAWSAGALISLSTELIVMAEGSSIGSATPITMGGEGGMQPVDEKVTSALRSEFRATAEATGRSAAIAEAMVDRNLAVGGVIASGRLVNLTTNEALDVGFAEAQVNSLEELLELVGAEGQEVTDVEESWSESLVRVLTGPLAQILMSIGMLGLFFELASPGFGWAGALGISCLVLFFAGHMLVDLAGVEEILLFVAGLGLIAVEVFVIPGFGIVGVLGIVAVVASLTMALYKADIDISLQPVNWRAALLRVMLSLVGTVAFTILLVKVLPRTAVGRAFVLREALAGGPNVGAGTPDECLSVGMTGTAHTGLRPYGKARFGDQRVEVAAEGGFIERGTRIRIMGIKGNRVEVRSVSAETQADTTSAAGDVEAEV